MNERLRDEVLQLAEPEAWELIRAMRDHHGWTVGLYDRTAANGFFESARGANLTDDEWQAIRDHSDWQNAGESEYGSELFHDDVERIAKAVGVLVDTCPACGSEAPEWDATCPQCEHLADHSVCNECREPLRDESGPYHAACTT